MQTIDEPQPTIPDEAKSENGPQPRGPRRRVAPSRETLVVRGLQVAVGAALLGAWQWAAAAEWPDPVLAKSPLQSWDYLVSAARSGALWSNTRSTMTARC